MSASPNSSKPGKSPEEVAARIRESVESTPPIISRWMDMSAYGMSLKRVSDDERIWVALEGGDRDPKLATKLGFTKEASEWVMRESTITPRSILAAAPKTVFRPFVREDVMDTTRMSTPPAYKTAAVPAAPEEPLLGLDAAARNLAKIQDLDPLFREWIDMSAYGMAVKIACDDESLWYSLEGGDSDPELAKKLGFERLEGEWLMVGQNFSHGRFAAEAPLSARRDFYREDALDTSRMTSQPEFIKPSRRPPEWNPPVNYGV